MTRFKALDGWRGICALLVALFHFKTTGHYLATNFGHNAYLFVDFFFVLSGFVISHAYMGRLDSGPKIKEFIIRRFGRLWPLHVAVLATFVGFELVRLFAVQQGIPRSLVGPFSFTPSMKMIVPNLLMIHSVGFPLLAWHYQSWSISAEFLTYLAFAAACLLAVKSRVPLKLFQFILPVAGFAVLFFCTDRNMYSAGDFGFFRCLCGFFLGQWTYELWKTGRFQASDRALAALEFAVLALVLLFISFAGRTAWAILAPLVFSVAVWVFAQERGAVSRIMKSGPIESLGAWSYSIYMVHSFILEVFLYAFKAIGLLLGARLLTEVSVSWQGFPMLMIDFKNAWASDLLALGYGAIVVAVAATTYRFIEQPGIAFFNRLARRTSPATSSVKDFDLQGSKNQIFETLACSADPA